MRLRGKKLCFIYLVLILTSAAHGNSKTSCSEIARALNGRSDDLDYIAAVYKKNEPKLLNPVTKAQIQDILKLLPAVDPKTLAIIKNSIRDNELNIEMLLNPNIHRMILEAAGQPVKPADPSLRTLLETVPPTSAANDEPAEPTRNFLPNNDPFFEELLRTSPPHLRQDSEINRMVYLLHYVDPNTLNSVKQRVTGADFNLGILKEAANYEMIRMAAEGNLSKNERVRLARERDKNPHDERNAPAAPIGMIQHETQVPIYENPNYHRLYVRFMAAGHDAEHILQIEKENWGAKRAWDAVELKRVIPDTQLRMVAEAGDKVAGYLFCTEREKELSVINLGVHPEFVAEGVGIRLIRKLQDRLRLNWTLKITLDPLDIGAKEALEDIGFTSENKDNHILMTYKAK